MFKKMWIFDKILFLGRICTAVLDGILPPLSAFLLKILIDSATEGDFNKSLVYIGIIAAVNFAAGVIRAWIDRKFKLAEDLFMNSLTFDFNAKLINIDCEILYTPKMMQQKEIAAKVIQTRIASRYLDGTFAIISSIISIISVGYLLSSVSWWVYAVMLALCAINIITMTVEKRASISNTKDLAPINTEISYYMTMLVDENYANDMRMYSISDWVIRKYKTMIKKSNNLLKDLLNKRFSISLLRTVLSTAENIFLYTFAAVQMIFFNMSFANFSLVISTLNTFSSSVSGIAGDVVSLSENSEYMQIYREFMETENKIAVDNTGLPLKNIEEQNDCITFRNVSFAYPGSESPTLKDININIEKGKFYVIVGENGAGKTTLCRLICRLYDVEEGEILYCGENIKNINYKEYRNNIGIVFQDYKYYCMSIAENVAMNEYNGSDEIRAKITKALNEAGLGEKIESLPKGIDTQLGRKFDDEGILLSGGELQKMALARVIFKDPSVVILDEPSSALDAFAEDELIQSFNRVLKGKTVLYISHRMSVAKYSDGVIYINGGKVMGFGSHEELEKTVPEYKSLYDAQVKHYR